MNFGDKPQTDRQTPQIVDSRAALSQLKIKIAYISKVIIKKIIHIFIDWDLMTKIAGPLLLKYLNIYLGLIKSANHIKCEWLVYAE